MRFPYQNSVSISCYPHMGMHLYLRTRKKGNEVYSNAKKYGNITVRYYELCFM
jgi:hypothetical protein